MRYTPPRRPQQWSTASIGKVLFVLPVIDDDEPPERKQGMAIRSAANVAGVCPECGARFVVRETDSSGVLHAHMEHEDGCAVLMDEAAS